MSYIETVNKLSRQETSEHIIVTKTKGKMIRVSKQISLILDQFNK